jgi:NTE family protein
LVFSAGGAFGAYQAGAWRALEEAGFRPDIVVGASIGSVNATAVARGCSADRLQQLWRDRRSNVFRWNWPPRSLSLLDNRPLLGRIRELLAEFPHPLPGVRLILTQTELPSTRIRILDGSRVTPEDLLAACAIPGVFPLVQRKLDGGLFCRLPAALAADAGAEEILTVDLLAAPPSKLARVTLTAVSRLRRLLIRERDLRRVPDHVVVRRIESATPLGSLEDLLRWDPRLIDRWIEAGYRDAARLLQTTSPTQASAPRAESAAPR